MNTVRCSGLAAVAATYSVGMLTPSPKPYNRGLPAPSFLSGGTFLLFVG